MPDRYFFHAFLIVAIGCYLGIAIPAVAVTPGEIEPHRISPEHARVLAQAAFLEFVISGSPGLVSGSWEGSVIAPNPVIIYDINGEPLFYQFDVITDEGLLGGMKIGASRVLPSSVMTIELTPPSRDTEEAEDMAEASFYSICPGCTLVSSYPVCYSYPKIGLKISYIRPGSDVREEFILDEATSTRVPDELSWSYYGSIEPETVSGNRDAWDEEEAIHQLVLEKARVYGYPETTTLNQDKIEALREATASYYRAGSSGAVIRGTEEAATAAAGKKILPITLYPQEASDWCGVAAIQMISDYFGQHYTQSQIAAWTNTRTGGTYIDDEVEFFWNHLGKQESYADYSPSFQKEAIEIDNNRPFSSTVASQFMSGYHGRVGAGYSDEWGRSEILIYDPWPMNEGSVYWEAYSSAEHLCDVYIRGSDSPRIQPPVARFHYTYEGTTASFNDLSTGNPDAWYWTFGDGTTATAQNPSHTYSQAGSYWVTLEASNGGGSSRVILAVYIPPGTPLPTAVPAGTPTLSRKPPVFPKVYPTVVPTTAPTVSVTAYPLIFPKVYPTVVPTTAPTVSVTAYPPVFPKQYPTAVPTTAPTVSVTKYPPIFPKVYPTVVPTTAPKVSLTKYPPIFPKLYPTGVPTTAPTVSSGLFSTVITFVPVASFQYSIQGSSVTFMDTSEDAPNVWSWNFGDGTSSTEMNPSHTYGEDGTYTVTLTVSNSAGSSEILKIITIASSKIVLRPNIPG